MASKTSFRVLNSISLLLSGLAIGWLIGLSSEPIIQTVIGSVLIIITSFITVLYSLQNNEESKSKLSLLFGEIHIFPIALFLIGLSLSITLGMYVRMNNFSIFKSANNNTTILNTINSDSTVLINEKNENNTKEKICGTLDPDQWNNDWLRAKDALKEIQVSESFNKLILSIENNVLEEQRFKFLLANQVIVCKMEKDKIDFVNLKADLNSFTQNENTKPIAELISVLASEKQENLLKCYFDFLKTY